MTLTKRQPSSGAGLSGENHFVGVGFVRATILGDFRLGFLVACFVICAMGRVSKRQAAMSSEKTQGQQGCRVAVSGDFDQDMGDHCRDDLKTNGVFAVAQKVAQFEMLLEPAEQEFDLPALLVAHGDCDGRVAYFIGDQGESLAVIRFDGDKAQAHGKP